MIAFQPSQQGDHMDREKSGDKNGTAICPSHAPDTQTDAHRRQEGEAIGNERSVSLFFHMVVTSALLLTLASSSF